MASLLDAFGIELHLFIAQLVNFGVLFVALMYLLYKPVMKSLDERRAVVAQGVEDAQAASEALEGAEEKAKEVMLAAETEAGGIVARGKQAASDEGERIVSDAQTRAQSIEESAKARAVEEHARVLRESEKEIARLAILAAEKAMRERAA